MDAKTEAILVLLSAMIRALDVRTIRVTHYDEHVRALLTIRHAIQHLRQTADR